MKNEIEQAFYVMCKRYVELLEDFYPARDKAGFTERNQVHFYINSLMKKLNDENAVEWLEFPWKDKKQHIDAVVYSPKHRTVFYIEAKRFSMKSKVKSIKNDISRVCKSDREFKSEYGIKNVEHEYLIVLSDVWLETKWKRSVPSWWIGCALPKQVLLWEGFSGKSLSIEKDSFIDFLKEEDGVDWSGSRQDVYWIGEKIKHAKNYCLLIGWKKI